jgi:hypothetical protein
MGLSDPKVLPLSVLSHCLPLLCLNKDNEPTNSMFVFKVVSHAQLYFIIRTLEDKRRNEIFSVK